MIEHRKNTRYLSFAKAKIEGVNAGESLLKDLSVTGCCVECTSYVELAPNVRYRLEIIPETTSKIGIFNLLVESKWIHSESYSCDIGFCIVESPKGKHFERYVDYLSWRYAQGSSMTGDNNKPNSSE